MHNVTHEVVGDKLVITVDIGATAISGAPPSASGKTRLVGSSGSAMPVACKHGAVSFALNVMCKNR